MSAVAFPPPPAVFRPAPATWLLAPVAALFLYLVFAAGLEHLVHVWRTREEYSYGFIIPIVVAFLVWQRKDRLERIRPAGSWIGVGLVAGGIAVGLAGKLAWSPLIVNYGFLLAVWGLAAAYLGWAGLRVIAAPLAMLLLMLPLPEFVLVALSQELQLLSSRLGVALIRMCDISVYLEGNVIDLGSMKLQVVEACSGLRYLFALMTLALIAAYFFNGALWKRAVIFLSSIPITVLMNSVRIALVGLTVEHFGRDAAEGLLHDFEGMVVFMGCVGLLVAQMWLLARIGRNRLPLRSAFGLDLPASAPAGTPRRRGPIPVPALAAVGALGLAAATNAVSAERVMERPARRAFAEYPLQVGDWRGRNIPMEREHLELLRPDDYLLADFLGAAGKPVNLFVAYFATQTDDRAPHSPRACIPGAGWEIAHLSRRELGTVRHAGVPLVVNRAVIRRGEQTQLVYYWLHQGGRAVTNEYAAKLHVLRNTVLRGRSDGSLVRFVTPIFPAEGEAGADARLTAFAAAAVPGLLGNYLPD